MTDTIQWTSRRRYLSAHLIAEYLTFIEVLREKIHVSVDISAYIALQIKMYLISNGDESLSIVPLVHMRHKLRRDACPVMVGSHRLSSLE